jgi:hypothetical protein
LTQQELLGKDVDLSTFNLQMDTFFAVNLTEQILAATISRTIDGSSTLTVDVADPRKKLLRSGRLASRNIDIQIDGLWWRYVRCEKNGTVITMTFEDREIATLRQYREKLGPISRDSITRAEFIVKMLNEVEQFVIPYYIPEIHKPQPVFNKQGVEQFPVGRDTQVPKHSNLTVKHVKATLEQISVVDAILTQGDKSVPDSNPHKHKILVSALMTATQESTMKNLPYGDKPGWKGAFQQNPEFGWPASGDVSVDAAAYFTHAVANDKANPNYTYGELCQSVQGSKYPTYYDQWRTEAERWVAASGKVPDNYYSDRKTQQANYTAASGGSYHYWRGIPPSNKNTKWQGEDSWTCIQRLAEEVNWKAFFVSGVFYFMSETELFNSQPRATWSEDDDGIDSIDGDFDTNKIQATMSVRLRMGRYQVTPGSVVQLYDMGPFNGRWLVETIDRSMFDTNGSMNLKKPSPAFAEPYQDELQATQAAKDGNTNTDPQATTAGKQGSANVTKGPPNVIAGKILEYQNKRYFDDHGGDEIAQWRKAASGLKWHACTGKFVSCDPKLAQAVLWILDSGWQIGTFAICEDHGCENPDSQHLIGQAIDISSVGKVNGQRYPVNTYSPAAKELIKEFMVFLRDIAPNQVICNGNGYDQDDVKALQWSHGQQVSYITTDHTDHVHLGI